MAVRLLVPTLLLALLAGCAGLSGSKVPLQEVFALRNEAENLYQRGDYRAALAVYQTLSERVPEHTYTWFRMGNCHARLDNYEAAIDAYQRALTLDPEYSRAWLNLAYVQAQQLANTAIAMYELVPPGDPEAERIYALVEGVLQPFGETLGPLPDFTETGQPAEEPGVPTVSDQPGGLASPPQLPEDEAP